jgi:hypothetical protein
MPMPVSNATQTALDLKANLASRQLSQELFLELIKRW